MESSARIVSDPAGERIVEHYTTRYDESKRLTDAFGQLERTRTEALLERYLPPPPAQVLDVGGAHGAYSFAMAARGHSVHLVDIVPRHIEMAREHAAEEGIAPLAGMTVGDARAMDFGDASADAIVLHGPLYHLPRPEDRSRAWAEASRCLRPGGVLLAFAINRYAGVAYGISRELIYGDDYMRMISTEVREGRRANPPGHLNTLPSAYFHLPDELRAEAEAAGFMCESVLGVIGPVWQVPQLERDWADAMRRARLVELSELLEHEPVLGPRLLAVCRKPG